MPVDHLAAHYLSTFRAGREFNDGLSFAKALGQVGLDDSIDSLARIDRLLKQIRVQLKPDFASFYDTPANQSFMYLLGFYIGELVARSSGAEIHWHEHAELAARMPPEAKFPLRFSTSLSCIIGDAHFIALSAAEEQLFAEQPSDSVLQSASRMLHLLKPPEHTHWPRSDGAAGPITADQEGMAERAGFLAAYAIWMVADGGDFMPTLLTAQRQLQALALSDSRAAVQTGADILARNPDAAPHLALAWDGYLRTDGNAADMIRVDARCYHADRPATAGRILVGVPYQPAQPGRPFSVGVPLLLETDRPPALHAALRSAFYRGVDGFKQPKEVWPRTPGTA